MRVNLIAGVPKASTVQVPRAVDPRHRSPRDMFDRCDEAARLCLFRSRLIAAAIGGPSITPEHLILGIVEAIPRLIDSVGGRPNTARTVASELNRLFTPCGPAVDPVLLPFSPRLKDVLRDADGEALALDHVTTRPEHLLLSCMKVFPKSLAAHVVEDAGIGIPQIRAFLLATPRRR